MGYLLSALGGLFLGVMLTALVAAGRYDEVYLDGIERGRELEKSKDRAKMLLDDIEEDEDGGVD